MIANLSAAQLAHVAEARMWRILVDTDEQISGLEPSRVRDMAKFRLLLLDRALAGVSAEDRERCLGYVSDDECNQAYDTAGAALRDCLAVIERITNLGDSRSAASPLDAELEELLSSDGRGDTHGF